jgi:hypothetical protein
MGEVAAAEKVNALDLSPPRQALNFHLAAARPAKAGVNVKVSNDAHRCFAPLSS